MFRPVLALLLLVASAGSLVAQVRIGTHVWTTANLEVVKFRNGDSIPEAKDNLRWEEACRTGQPAWCYYQFDKANGKKYGKIYNWFAVADRRGLAPKGWHVPTREEWKELDDSLRVLKPGEEVPEAGSEAGIKLKANTGWEEPGNNKSGFNAVPAGLFDPRDGFGGQGSTAMWWASTMKGIQLFYYALYRSSSTFVMDNGTRLHGFTVRLVKDPQ